jgi:hypothetical protein
VYRFKFHREDWPFTLVRSQGFATQGFVSDSYVSESAGDSFSQATQLKLLEDERMYSAGSNSGAASL